VNRCTTIHGPENIAAELRRFVERSYRYPGWLLQLDRMTRTTRGFASRVARRLRRAGRR
jgi:hypothetical protein